MPTKYAIDPRVTPSDARPPSYAVDVDGWEHSVFTEDTEPPHRWYVFGSPSQAYLTADAAIEAIIGPPIGDVRVPEDLDDLAAMFWDEELDVLRQGFEYELCHECGRDLVGHVIAPGRLGEVRAWCHHAR